MSKEQVRRMTTVEGNLWQRGRAGRTEGRLGCLQCNDAGHNICAGRIEAKMDREALGEEAIRWQLLPGERKKRKVSEGKIKKRSEMCAACALILYSIIKEESDDLL